MNFFERELRKIVSPHYPGAAFIGRACYVPLGEGVRAKIQFVTCGHADHYDALKMTVLNPKEGEVDSLLLRFSDLFEKKQVSNPNFPKGIYPHIWVDQEDPHWYIYKPTTQDYATLGSATAGYLGLFMEQKREISATIHQPTMSM